MTQATAFLHIFSLLGIPDDQRADHEVSLALQNAGIDSFDDFVETMTTANLNELCYVDNNNLSRNISLKYKNKLAHIIEWYYSLDSTLDEDQVLHEWIQLTERAFRTFC